MIILLSILSVIVGLLLIIAIFGMTLPRTATLERSILINADNGKVFSEVSNLRNFVTWNPWTKKDPAIQLSFAGEDGTVGSSFSWKGNNKVGEGTMTVTRLEPNALATMEMNFGPRGKAKASFILQEVNGKSNITWAFESDMGNALRRGAMTGMMKKFVSKDYDEGLKNLKEKIEG